MIMWQTCFTSWDTFAMSDTVIEVKVDDSTKKLATGSKQHLPLQVQFNCLHCKSARVRKPSFLRIASTGRENVNTSTAVGEVSGAAW